MISPCGELGLHTLMVNWSNQFVQIYNDLFFFNSKE
eukprot:UN18575